jgi:hypothetical protein
MLYFDGSISSSTIFDFPYVTTISAARIEGNMVKARSIVGSIFIIVSERLTTKVRRPVADWRGLERHR